MVSVTFLPALLLPAATPPKAKDAGATFACSMPAPASDAGCGLFEAVSVTVSVPVSAPMTEGVNVTKMVHFELAGTLLPQLLVWAKSPLVVIVEMARAESRLLVKVIVFAALVVFSA